MTSQPVSLSFISCTDKIHFIHKACAPAVFAIVIVSVAVLLTHDRPLFREHGKLSFQCSRITGLLHHCLVNLCSKHCLCGLIASFATNTDTGTGTGTGRTFRGFPTLRNSKAQVARHTGRDLRNQSFRDLILVNIQRGNHCVFLHRRQQSASTNFTNTGSSQNQFRQYAVMFQPSSKTNCTFVTNWVAVVQS